MLKNPEIKYKAASPVPLERRCWPDNEIMQAPIWMSTDLRDGNQALLEPMNVETKLAIFELLIEIGFKQIEVAFPSASQLDYDFVRKLIEEDRIPDDVTIEVLTQAREHLIKRTVQSLAGAKKAIVHIYNPTAPVFRNVVFQKTQDEVVAIAVSATQLLRKEIKSYPETQWEYQYSPEVFSMTELGFAKRICDEVVAAWGADAENKIIINLPATVEASTPNIYADQIEWMHRNLKQRDAIVLSVHPHNDRGTAVAAAELAVMAGADRVEGCLFGNGERTGNVDLVTLALNLYTQGINPQLDFSNMDKIQKMATQCTHLPVHPRHPYAGELVFTAFSGSHQDAIAKGFAARDKNKDDGIWDIPYLPLDPHDIGRSYDAVIRVNSQSGKGGVAFMLQHVYGIRLPRKMQIEFSAIVQPYAEAEGGEISAQQIYALFKQHYLNTDVVEENDSDIGSLDIIKLERQYVDFENIGHVCFIEVKCYESALTIFAAGIAHDEDKAEAAAKQMAKKRLQEFSRISNGQYYDTKVA